MDIQRALHARVEKLAKPMLITLTLVSQPKDKLSAKIDELYSSFRRLRSLPLVSRACRGGAAFLEITRGKKGDRWHVHFHIVADADYMPQADLARDWKAASRGSSVVWVERPASGDGIAYSAKYAAKGLDFNIAADTELLDEVVLALKGRRLAFCFGDWYGTSFAADIEEDRMDPEETAAAPWRTICTLQTAAACALEGDAQFIRALLATRIADWLKPALRPPP